MLLFVFAFQLGAASVDSDAGWAAEWQQRFLAGVSVLPEVLEVVRMAGETDYWLRVAVRDMAHFDDFYGKLIAAGPLKNVTSKFAMERCKSSTAYPVLADPAG